jgi:hypothetical protein
MENNLTVQETDNQKKIIKYLLFGIIISISVRYIPTNQINNKEILMIGAIESMTFAILDMISPSIKIN